MVNICGSRRLLVEKMEVVFENDDLIVVNKPSGLVATNENRVGGESVENWLRTEKKINLKRGGLVHRLDKGTSGLLVAAKNEIKLDELQKLWKDRKVVKKYMALVSGKFPFEAKVDMPIGRDSLKFDRFAVKESGKYARTDFKLIKIITIGGKQYSLLEADLKTGRTHQIRVHLKYLRWPIVGDRVYGGEMVIDRPFLHSYYLQFDKIKIEIGLSNDLLEFIGKDEKV